MKGYCSECYKSCEVVAEDVGIGPYEFWGAKCNDSRYVPSSDCCRAVAFADIDEEGNLFNEILDIEDPNDGLADYLMDQRNDERWEKELDGLD